MEFLNKYSGTVDMKFRYFAEIYIADCKVSTKPTTYPGKKNMFQKHILPYFGEMKLNKITAITVRQWHIVMMVNLKKFKKTYYCGAAIVAPNFKKSLFYAVFKHYKRYFRRFYTGL